MNMSKEMQDVIKQTHKYSTTMWDSTYGHTYIGYGHFVTAAEIKEQVFKDKISKTKANRIFVKDIEQIEKQVNRLLDNAVIPQQHFDVFCHLVYDISYKGVRNSQFYLKYKECLDKDIELKDNMIQCILVWSKIKGHYSKAMAYRRQTDVRVYTSSDYKVV